MFADFFASVATLGPAFLIALSFHEYAHALVATVLGDDTPRRTGRLTINPFAHIDFIGLLFLFLFKIGWARPVIFNCSNFKHPRFFTILTALAGPFVNFSIAILFLYFLRYFPFSLLSTNMSIAILQVVVTIVYINVMLGAFNLLPIPPLDGSHVWIVFLAKKYPFFVLKLHQYSFFVLLFLFLLPQARSIFSNLVGVIEVLLKQLVF